MADDFQFSTLNMLTTDARLGVSEGIAYDPPFLYVTPHNDYVVAKVDTRTFQIVATLDLSVVNPSFTGLSDSFVVGRYLYILPHFTTAGPFYQTDVIRVDLDNFAPSGVSSLHVIDTGLMSGTYVPRDGFATPDGLWGFVNIRTSNKAAVIRFGLGANFIPASVSIINLTTTTGADAGYPIINANFLCCDNANAYALATARHAGQANNANARLDLYLIAIPINNWNAGAAVFTRLTHLDFPAASQPTYFQIIDDGTYFWTYPFKYSAGDWVGQTLPVLKIPKANPAATVITAPPVGQGGGISSIQSGQAIYDGWRYGYALTSEVGVTPQIMQLDTHNPGTVNLIDYSAYCPNLMWGLWGDGYWSYAVGFTNGPGLLLRFRPTLPPTPSPDDMVTLETVDENLVTLEIATED